MKSPSCFTLFLVALESCL